MHIFIAEREKVTFESYGYCELARPRGVLDLITTLSYMALNKLVLILTGKF